MQPLDMEYGNFALIMHKNQSTESIAQYLKMRSLRGERNPVKNSPTTDNPHRQLGGGARPGQRRGPLHIRQKNPSADEWKSMYQALWKIENYFGLTQQWVVRHAKAHATGESRKHMKDKMHFNTQGNGKSDELAKLGADMDTARRAEWLASEMQDEREKENQSIQNAVHVHEGGGELNDLQKLEDRPQEKNKFQKKSGKMGTRGSEVARRSSVCVPKKQNKQ